MRRLCLPNRRAAEMNSAQAVNDLGIMRHQGPDVAQDYSEALSLYPRSKADISDRKA